MDSSEEAIRKAEERLEKAELALKHYLEANKAENTPKYRELHRELDAAKDALAVLRKKV